MAKSAVPGSNAAASSVAGQGALPGISSAQIAVRLHISRRTRDRVIAVSPLAQTVHRLVPGARCPGYHERQRSVRKHTWRVAILLSATGFCAVVYQIGWLREFRLIFGASTAAAAAVLAI